MRLNCYLAATLAAVAAITGCEWTGSSESFSWNDSYDIVNFSGTYRRTGGYVATIQSAVIDTITTTTVPNANTNNVSTRTEKSVSMYTWGTTAINQRNYSGVASYGDVVPGSFMIYFGSTAYVDDGGGNLLDSKSAIKRGSITYSSGAWAINLPAGSLPAGLEIRIKFSYYEGADKDSNSGNNGGTTTTTGTGKMIAVQTITVSQIGQNITLYTSNSQVFEGKITGMDLDNTLSPTAVVNAKFTATCGNEKIVGTLMDNATQRIISGTWIRSGDYFDVLGYAAAATRKIDYSNTESEVATEE